MVDIVTPPITKKKNNKSNKIKDIYASTTTTTTTTTRDLTNEDDAYNAIFSGDFGSLNIGSFIDSGDHDARNQNTTEHLPDAIDFEDEDELADEEDAQQNNNGNSNIMISNDINNVYSDNNVIFMNGNENDQILVTQHILDVYNELILDDKNQLANVTTNNAYLMEGVGFSNDNNFDHLDINGHNINVSINYKDNNYNNALFMIDNNLRSNADENDNSNNNNKKKKKKKKNLNAPEFPANHINTIGVDLKNGYPKNISFNKTNHDQINQNKPLDNHIYNLFDLSIENNNMTIQDSKIRHPLDDEDMKKYKEHRDKPLLQYYFPMYKKDKILKWNCYIYRKRHDYQYQSKLLVSLLYPNGNMDGVKPFGPTNLKFKVQ